MLHSLRSGATRGLKGTSLFKASFGVSKTVLSDFMPKAPEEMFCFQCEQTSHGRSCTSGSNCGKTAEVSALQDYLVYILKGVSMYAKRAGDMGRTSDAVDRLLMEGMFSTVTNVNFSAARIADYIGSAIEMRSRARRMYEEACASSGRSPEVLSGPATAMPPSTDVAALIEEGRKVSILGRKEKFGEDVTSLQEIITYGLKGAMAYAHHAAVVGSTDGEMRKLFHQAMDFLTTDAALSIGDLLGMALKTGEASLKAMELLEKGHLEHFGSPVPTPVSCVPKKGKAILVTGHDLLDLQRILQKALNLGVNVYTHGEMLPAHGYPKLKAFPNLVGNFGTAWQNQRVEFPQFPGPIVFTTNCLLEPRPSYRDLVFTKNAVGFDRVKHLKDDTDFSEVVEKALSCDGFPDKDYGKKDITVGFGKNAILAAAPAVIEAIQKGAIKEFYVIGGCDGAERGRNYFTDLALSLPRDRVILTLGCGKYRFNMHDFGTVPGTPIPRLLDMGQCNDAYGAIQVALTLSKVLKTPVNDLPIRYAVSWFEQKAVAVLLAMLHLGIQGIHLGPKLPAFVSPNVLNVLVEKFKLAPVTTPLKDFGISKA